MFSTIDQHLFPNDCVVLKTPHNRYVYPIFKNGSSSVFSNPGFQKMSLKEIKLLDVIDVYVRDPHERFLSGVQTFIDRLGPHLDKNTVLHFVETYLYLNRHYCPQVFWLLNLSRYTDAKFFLQPVSALNELTKFQKNKSTKDPDIEEYFKDKIKVKFFNEMDEVLTVNLINQTVSMSEIIKVLKQNYQDLYDETFSNAKKVINTLSKL